MAVGITEVILRDGHQSMIATRMRTEDMLPILDKLDEVGFYSLEMWGGATFDVCMRFLNEDPWERLRAIRKGVKKTKLQMLLRGQNLVGYRHYPDDIVIKFVESAARNGIDIFRIFDALNDIRNMEVAIKTAKSCGSTVEGSISYTISPVHTIEKYIVFARDLAALECDIICIKDMAGLLTPNSAHKLTATLKKEVGLPVHVHSHTTGGVAQMSLYSACEAGADYLDTCISPFSLGSSHTPTESMVAALKETPFDTGIDLKLLTMIAAYFQKIKEKYRALLDPIAERVDTNVLVHQIPGGMLSNLVSQLKEQNALDKYEEVLREVPHVRAELGYPPLVTPTSQIVGTQAVFNVVTGQRYKLISKEVKDYIRGLYGKPPAPVDKNVYKLAIGDEPVTYVRPADLLQPLYDTSRKECVEYSDLAEDILSYALFPQVALKFFKARKSGELITQVAVPQRMRIQFGESDNGKASVQVGDRKIEYSAERKGHSLILTIGSSTYEIDILSLPEAMRAPAATSLSFSQKTTVLSRNLSTKPAPSKKESEKGGVFAPMPGKVVDILVSPGQTVEKSTVLVVLEAMKMQNEISAPYSSRVKELRVSKGDNVNGGDLLVVME